MDKDDIIAYYVGQLRVHTFECLTKCLKELNKIDMSLMWLNL